MSIQEQVLATANRLASTRRDWTFSPMEVVNALPALNENSVRTHIVSRCCMNARKNHLHKWDYFERVARGRYQVVSKYRQQGGETSSLDNGPANPGKLNDTIHAVIRKDRDTYTVECLEVAVVTQGRDLDEVARNLQEAIKLHLDGENLAEMGIGEHPRVQMIFDAPFQL